MFNSTQIVDAVMTMPDVVWGWFWGLGFTVKLSVLGVVLAAYPVSVHFFGLFKRKGNDRLTQSVEVNVNVPERIDSQTFAEKVYEDQRKELKDAHQLNQSKDEEIKALKDVIDGLREPQETPEEDDHAAQAEVELAKGNTNLAKAFFKEAAKKNVAAGNERYLKAAEAYRRLGALDYMSNPKVAFDAYLQSVDLDPNNAEGWNRIGQLRHLFGELEEAEKAYLKVLQFDDDKKWKAIVYGNLGVIRQTQGDLGEAEKLYNKALILDEELESKEGLAIRFGNLGSIRKIQGDLCGAEDFFIKALEINNAISNDEILAANYANLASIREIQGDLKEANEFYRKALEVSIELGNKAGVAAIYNNFGLVRQAQRDFKGASELYRKALEISTELGSKNVIAASYGNLGNVCMVQGDFASAEKFYNKSLKIGEELGSKERVAIQFRNLGNIRQVQGDLEGAKNYWEQSLDLYIQIGAAPKIEQIQGLLDNLESNKDN